MNPISLRRTLQVTCMSVACATLPACAGNRVVGQSEKTPQVLDCPGLQADPVSYPISGTRDTTIEYPQHEGRIAVLKIPHGAVPTNTTITIGSPDSEHTQIDIEAKDGAGNSMTDFHDHPLKLTVFVYKVCKPQKPASGGSFYVYRIPVEPGKGLGGYDHHPFTTPRVTADLDHLSGYILAQGFLQGPGH